MRGAVAKPLTASYHVNGVIDYRQALDMILPKRSRQQNPDERVTSSGNDVTR